MELGKIRITAAVSITTVTGYLLKTSRPDPSMAWTVLGIFLLASGASALNHLQEYRYDSKMPRTMNRPLPAGRISRSGVIAIALAYSLPGSFLLYTGAGGYGLLLGWLAFFWYNGVYTYLKRYTAWAVIPGSLIGSIPPVIGWISAGGELADPFVIPIAAFFFIWQVPHFWLLLMKYGTEYESVGFPSLSGTMKPARMGRLIYGWVFGTALVTVVFTFAGPMDSGVSKIGLWVASGWLLLTFTPILRKSLAGFRPGKYFKKINYFVLFVVVFMCLDKLFLEILHI
jgi:protoheme IX farnesyltransferase